MAEKLEDLNLPNTTVYKLIKEAVPDNVNIGKDARAALSKAASIFVLYVTSQAIKEAHKGNRKTLSGHDVMQALEELEFEEFIEPLQVVLKEFQENKLKKSKAKKTADADDPEDAEMADEPEDPDDVEENTE